MRKETIIKWLANFCLLIPGNIKSRSGWYISFYTITSLIGLGLVIFHCTVEVISYNAYAEDRKTNEVFLNLTRPPIRPVAYCVKQSTVPGGDNIVERASSNESLPLQTQDSKAGAPKRPPPPNDSNYLEDIVGTSDRLLAYGVNVCVRIFVWLSFPLMIDIFIKLFDSKYHHENLSGQQTIFMVQLWSESVQMWSLGEKIFLLTIALSQFQKELDIFFQFQWSLEEVGMDLIDIPCLLIQITVGQFKILTSRELVMEVATFFLVVIMKTFVNMLRAVAEKEDVKYDHITGDGSASIGTGKPFGKLDKSDNLFLRTREMLLTSELKMGNRAQLPFQNNKIASIHEHISEVVGPDYDGDHRESSLIFKISQRKELGKLPDQGEENDTGKDIYSKINFIISMYFELMATWEQCSKITGFVALLLFAELTSTFCFNTYMTLDSAMTFGLFSGMGIGGILRGIVIIAKFVCVCNTAQTLKDMTPILLDRILKLKLKLLSLPTESLMTRKFSDIGNDNYGNKETDIGPCERCRGLGSFLSEMVSYIKGHPFELSALGYFTVSRSTLTTITGVIVTYLVVLVQFQSYASAKA